MFTGDITKELEMGRTLSVQVGDEFERLKITKILPLEGKKKRKCLCDCSCGNKDILVQVSNLITLHTRSCGCLEIEKPNSLKHGCARKGQRTPEYRSWDAMKSRVGEGYWEKASIFPGWLGEGGFENFLAHIGPCPKDMCASGKLREYTVDRYPNKEGNYEPGNVRWATKKQQADNRKERSKSVIGRSTDTSGNS